MTFKNSMEAMAALVELGAAVRDMDPAERAKVFDNARKSGNRKVRIYFAELETELARLAALDRRTKTQP